MPSARFVLGAVAIALTLTVPGLGHAQTCATDADCAKGLTCQTVANVTPVETCTADSAGNRTCTTEPAPVTLSCQPAPCASTADCGPAMICHSQTFTECTGTTPITEPCDPNATDCLVAPAPPSCTEKTITTCTYPWTLPCNVDADCGEGFTCKPSEISTCSGSSGAAPGGSSSSSGTGGAGEPAPPTPIDADLAVPVVTCTTVTSFPGHCQANAIACASDRDCPLSWTCADEVAVPMAPAPVDGGNSGSRTPVLSTAPKACTPPSIAVTDNPQGNGPTVGGGDEVLAPPPKASWGAPDASPEPGSVGIVLNTPDAGAATIASTPPVVTTNNQGTKNSESTPIAARTSSGGCSIAADLPPSAWPVSVLAALGLLIARRRRGQ